MVKRFLSVLVLGMAMLSAQAQYQAANSNFEQWESVSYSSTTGEEPLHWNSFLTSTGDYKSTIAKVQLTKSTEVRSGSTGQYCAKINAREVLAGIIAQGNMTSGQINGGSMSATDANGNYNFTNINDDDFNMPFTGRPDSMKVWVNFKGGDSSNPYGKVQVFLHGNGYYQDPIGNTSKLTAQIASANATPLSTNGWTELTIPFEYSSSLSPSYALISFSTNNVPGKGTTSDYMYVDDIQMIYCSDIKSATFNNAPITFVGNAATVNADYKEKFLKIVSGAGASFEYNFNTETYLLTVTVKGDNISEDPTNYHVYTIQFSGMASLNDDEADAVIVPETSVSLREPAGGWYYIRNKKSQNFIDAVSAGVSSNPHRWYVSGASVTDADGKVFKITASLTSHTFSSTGTSADADISFASASDGCYWIYGSKSGIGTYYTYLNASTTKIETKSSAPDADATNYWWEFLDANQYDRVNGFWQNYTNASLSNGVDAMAFVERNASNGVSAQEVEGLPLGLYKVGNGSIVYLSSGSKLTIPAGTTTLTYYGRVDLSLHATYDGETITAGGNVDAIYDASKLRVTLSGNGAQTFTTNFDEASQTLTITVSGYTRSNEYEIKFAAPTMTLATSWYGEVLEDGASVGEEYDAAHVEYNPGRGTSVSNAAYNDGTLTVTITSVYGEKKDFTYTFVCYPAVASSVDYTDTSLMLQTNGGNEYSNITATITIQTLVNGNLNFLLNNYTTLDSLGVTRNLGTLAAKNLKQDASGNFAFSGTTRTSDGTKIPFSVSAQKLSDGTLYAAVTMLYDKVSNYYSYGITTTDSQVFTDDVVVTINGASAGRKESNVTVSYLSNGNINFSLADFELDGVGKVGNIDALNLTFNEETGEFSYTGDLYVAPGSGNASQWIGPGLGAIPVVLRGQIINNNLALVIDIDFREQMSQVIHVTFGCDAGTPETYTDKLIVTINGESSEPQDATVAVGYLENGNINFSLKNFTLEGVGAVGNVSIDNLNMDAQGNFAYSGSIFVSAGDDPTVQTWVGPTLGIIPVELVGQIYTNEETGEKSLVVVIDIDFQQQNQTIHVSYGTTPDSTTVYTDDLVVTINGASTTKEDTDVTVGYLKNGNINFILKNFTLDGVGGVGNISLDNLALDENGKFSYNGVARIGAGDDPSVEQWLGPTLGDVPMKMKGQLFTYEGEEQLIVVIDIDMQESIHQTIHVTFGIHDVDTKYFTDDLKVSVNGTSNGVDESTVTVGVLGNGNINFMLNDFVLNGGMNVGNIALENLEVSEDGKFSFDGTTRIAAGSDASVEWLGPTLGDVPLKMKGQLYQYNGEEHIVVTIDIDMTDTKMKQYIYVTFGATPIKNTDYEGSLVVTINSVASDPMDATVSVGTLKNDNINFVLNNFILGGSTKVGNISVDNLEVDENGDFRFNGIIRIGAGDLEGTNFSDWLGPNLGNVPLDLVGHITGSDVSVDIAIDMTETSLQQMIYVSFTGGTPTVGGLAHVIAKLQSGKTTIQDVRNMVVKVLNK